MSTTIELPTATHGFRHSCEASNAPKLWKWIRERKGVAVWTSVNLSNPCQSWSSPVLIECRNCHGSGQFPDWNTCVTCNGAKLVKADRPNWQSATEPVVITDPAEVGVVTEREVKRFRVYTRVGGNGLQIKCTDASTRKIRRELEKAGEGASYYFDYDTAECIVTAPDGAVVSLADYAKKEGWL